MTKKTVKRSVRRGPPKRKLERWARQRQTDRAKAHDEKLAAAREVWSSLPEKTQLQIVAEIVETRGGELRQAYPDVIGLGHGYRTRKGRFVAEPCVTFLVRRKWSKRSHKLGAEQWIPEDLLTYWNVGRKRLLCAVPTDVEGLETYRKAKSQSYLKAEDSNGKAVKGALAAVLRVRAPNGTLDPSRYALSCLHVIGLAEHYYPDLPSSVRVSHLDSGALIGRRTEHCGYLLDLYLYSFDAGLAMVDDAGALHRVAPPPRPSKRIYGWEEIPPEYEIWTPRGKVPAIRGRIYHGAELDIPYQNIPKLSTLKIWHESVIESGAATRRGDSGSPVVTEDGGTLLGMHIAGGGRRAFMIPVWELLSGENYYGLSKDHGLRLDGAY